MKRYRCWFAVLGVFAVPAMAAACWPMWGGRAYAPRAYSPPMYAPMSGTMAPLRAPMSAPLAYGNLPYCEPSPRTILPPPRIETTPRIDSLPRTATPTPAPAPAPEVGATIPEPMPPLPTNTRPMTEPVRPGPLAEPVRPAAGSSDAPPKLDVPAIKKDEAPTVAPKPAELTLPPELTYPKVEIPMNLRPEPKAPKLDSPKEPDPRLVPKVPAVGAPREPMMIPAIPSAAPAPETIPTPAIPLMPDPKMRDPLPSLTLPPEIPVAPEKKPETTSHSSPLTAGARDRNVAVFPAKGGEAPPAGQRIVGFYNHTARDIALTIEGRAVKLPARSYLQAQLAPTFTWSHGDRPAARETVPAGAGGVDVVFRD